METSKPTVVIRFGAMGDMVMLLPVLNEIRRRHGEFPKIITSGYWAEPVLRAAGLDSEIFVVAGTRRRPYFLCRSKRESLRWLEALSPTTIYVLETVPKYADVLNRLDKNLTRIVDARRLQRLPKEHEVAYLMRVVADDCGGAIRSRPRAEFHNPKITIALEDREIENQWLGRRGIDGLIVLIQPGNKRTMSGRSLRRKSNHKFWPLERWSRVVEGICSRRPEASVLLMGTEQERALNEKIKLHPSLRSNRRIHNLAGEVPVERLIGLSGVAHSFISVDTGPAHIAAALGCPLVVLFGSSDPNRFRPRGPGPVAVVTQRGIDLTPGPSNVWTPDCNSLGIDPEQVIDAWELLSGAL